MNWRRVARRGWRACPTVAIAWVALVTLTGVASAHRIGGSRFATPIPLPLVLAGAGVTVAATAAWLGVAAETPLQNRTWRSGPVISDTIDAGVRYGARAVFLVGFVLALLHGVVGPQVEAENLATVFVWPIWHKGVALLAILLGSPWRVLSPWRTLYDGLVRLEGTEIAVVGGYPSWLGSWPAVVGFTAWIGIVENLTVIPRSPAATTLLIGGYATAMVVGAIAFGPSWFRHADALAALYRLLGRVAPIQFVASGDDNSRGSDDGSETTSNYRVAIRPPWSGCTERLRGVGVVAFVIAAVYTVSFDGFTSTETYQTVVFGLRDTLDSGPQTSVLVYLVGFGTFVATFAGVSAAVASLASLGGGLIERNGSNERDERVGHGGGDEHDRHDERGGWRAAALAFAPTVLPIAAAYEVAHNYPFVIENGGRLVALAWSIAVAPVDPIAPLDWLGLQAFWVSQVVLIVLGHVVAVVAAHDVALERYRTLRRARRAHLPLVVLMIGYTVLSLWIISRPVVGG